MHGSHDGDAGGWLVARFSLLSRDTTVVPIPVICTPKLVAGFTIQAWTCVVTSTRRKEFVRLTGLVANAADAEGAVLNVTPVSVRLTWFVSPEAGTSFTLLRRTIASSWSRLADLVPDFTGRLTFDDHEVVPGGRYGYSIGVHESGRETTAGETWVGSHEGDNKAARRWDKS